MNGRILRGISVFWGFLCTVTPVFAQKYRVDPRNMDERVLAIVPWTGSGVYSDPKRRIRPLRGAIECGSNERGLDESALGRLNLYGTNCAQRHPGIHLRCQR